MERTEGGMKREETMEGFQGRERETSRGGGNSAGGENEIPSHKSLQAPCLFLLNSYLLCTWRKNLESVILSFMQAEQYKMTLLHWLLEKNYKWGEGAL